MTTGDLIRKARIDKDWSQQKLADALEVHQSTLNKWEKNYRGSRPNSRQIERIATLLGVEPASLVGDDGTARIKRMNPEEKDKLVNEAILKLRSETERLRNEIEKLLDEIREKKNKIWELENTICEQWQTIEELKKQEEENSKSLREENEKLRKVLSDILIQKALEGVAV